MDIALDILLYCSDCGLTKPASQFHKDASRKTGRTLYCSDCANKRKRSWCLLNKNKISISGKLRAIKIKAVRAKFPEKILSHKICSKCGLDKPAQEYYKTSRRLSGLPSWCKACVNNYNQDVRKNPIKRFKRTFTWKKYQYGMTEEVWNGFLILQNNKCAICFTSFSEMPSSKICIDHDHNTKSIRGLLCSSCNTFIGHAKENAYFLSQAIEYLERMGRNENMKEDF